jgi:subtilisin family serine protease
MAIRGKIKVLESFVSAFDIEYIGDFPFYRRYKEIVTVVGKYISDIDIEMTFAEPAEEKNIIEWHIPKTINPISMSLLKQNGCEEEYDKYLNIRKNLEKRLKEISLSITDPLESNFFDCVVKFFNNNDDYLDKITLCQDDNVTFVLWGMQMLKGKSWETAVITDAVNDHRVHKVSFVIQGRGSFDGKTSILRKHGYILTENDIPKVKTDDVYSFAKWLPESPQGKKVTSDIEYTAVCEKTSYKIQFQASSGGKIDGNTTLIIKTGESLSISMFPAVIADEGYEFECWEPKIDSEYVVNEDKIYTAKFKELEVVIPEEITHRVVFDAGNNGIIGGVNSFEVKDGESIPETDVPKITNNKGYEFQGWDKSISNPITEDTTYHAIYKKIPWWKRLWLWLKGKGCLTWLVRILLFVLLLLLLYWLFRSCDGCSDKKVKQIDRVTRPDGKEIDDNGVAHPITDGTGKLPDGERIVAPATGDNYEELPIVREPGLPDIIANRLFLFMEEETDNIEALAKDFKKVYPDDKYSIIGYDKEVKLLVIQIPEQERNKIRQTINKKIPNHKFIVFDEEVYGVRGYKSAKTEDIGWHLSAIHLKQGWKYTKGSSNVKVAIVDDGIQANHPMFKGRIVDAYNVFTQNDRLSIGDGHGTHTAGLAVGSAEFYSKGASGVAPNCKLMPIQVFDNNLCPLSALIAGIMYAIHHGADVVNISIGPSFPGLNVLPVEQQDQIAQTQFGNVAILWARVCKLAATKKCILVFAAGNDDILTSIPPENRNASSIVVTAIDKRMYPTNFTNYGPCSDISAPGKNIYSAFPQSKFQSCDGTSMAAPIVTGTIALMKSIKKNLTIEQARNVLYSTGQDVYGWIPPMVLVDKALEATKRGDFKRVERESKNVPENVDIHLHSGRVEQDNNIVAPSPTKPSITESDREAIKRKIREYEEKIKE